LKAIAEFTHVHFPQVGVRSGNVASHPLRLSYWAMVFNPTVPCTANPPAATVSAMNTTLATRLLSLFLLGLMLQSASAATTELRVLFLGDNGHHRPADRFKQIQPVLANKGIEAVYTQDLADLNAARFAGFDCQTAQSKCRHRTDRRSHVSNQFVLSPQ
jgi:hypothetical protein